MDEVTVAVRVMRKAGKKANSHTTLQWAKMLRDLVELPSGVVFRADVAARSFSRRVVSLFERNMNACIRSQF